MVSQFKIFDMSALKSLLSICEIFLEQLFDTEAYYVIESTAELGHTSLVYKVNEEARLSIYRLPDDPTYLKLLGNSAHWLCLDKEAVQGLLSHKELLTSLMDSGMNDSDCSCRVFSSTLIFACGHV